MLGRVMKEKEFSSWTHFREQRDNCRIASGMGRRKSQPWGSGTLLWDSHRAPHGPQEIPEALPVHSQPVGSVTGTRIPLDKGHRECEERMDLPRPGSVSVTVTS